MNRILSPNPWCDDARQLARDCDLEGLRVFLTEEFVKWDNTLTVKVKKRAPAQELVRKRELQQMSSVFSGRLLYAMYSTYCCSTVGVGKKKCGEDYTTINTCTRYHGFTNIPLLYTTTTTTQR